MQQIINLLVVLLVATLFKYNLLYNLQLLFITKRKQLKLKKYFNLFIKLLFNYFQYFNYRFILQYKITQSGFSQLKSLENIFEQQELCIQKLQQENQQLKIKLQNALQEIDNLRTNGQQVLYYSEQQTTSIPYATSAVRSPIDNNNVESPYFNQQSLTKTYSSVNIKGIQNNIEYHTRLVFQLQIINKLLFSSSYDGTVRVFRCTDNKLIHTFRNDFPLLSTSLSQYNLATTSLNSKAQFIKIKQLSEKNIPFEKISDESQWYLTDSETNKNYMDVDANQAIVQNLPHTDIFAIIEKQQIKFIKCNEETFQLVGIKQFSNYDNNYTIDNQIVINDNIFFLTESNYKDQQVLTLYQIRNNSNIEQIPLNLNQPIQPLKLLNIDDIYVGIIFKNGIVMLHDVNRNQQTILQLQYQLDNLYEAFYYHGQICFLATASDSQNLITITSYYIDYQQQKLEQTNQIQSQLQGYPSKCICYDDKLYIGLSDGRISIINLE